MDSGGKLKGNCNDLESGGTLNRAFTTQPIPALWGIPLKYLSLITLAVQNSTLAIVMHYSRVPAPAAPATYSAATAVLISEILKGIISLIIAFVRVDTSGVSPDTTHSPRRPLVPIRVRKLCQEVFSFDCWRLSIPAMLYVLQNNLQYSAASNLPAATFQVTYQMKILTTAIFSVVLLRKRLSSTQWFSLFCLTAGVAVVQIQAGVQAHPSLIPGSPNAASAMDPLRGFSAVTAACFTSGLAGVYFEMVLKNTKSDLWVRNVQLSFFSILPALAPIFFTYQSQYKMPNGEFLTSLFSDFTPGAWATIAVQVFGGLITAVVIKYSDNILKGFATSLSIVISFVASVVLFHFRVSATFLLGSSIVLAATYMYNQPTSVNQPKSPEFDQEMQSWSPANEKLDTPSELVGLKLTLPSSSGSTSSLPSTITVTPYPQTQLTDNAIDGQSCHVRNHTSQLRPIIL